MSIYVSICINSCNDDNNVLLPGEARLRHRDAGETPEERPFPAPETPRGDESARSIYIPENKSPRLHVRPTSVARIRRYGASRRSVNARSTSTHRSRRRDNEIGSQRIRLVTARTATVDRTLIIVIIRAGL